jgi:hypothetical protein
MTGVGSGGCGCGQRGGSGSGCGCGKASATGVVHDGAFTRPTFFEGQLLTADDLQALADYGRAKDRLHNRYLVGSGVVCGLEVVCSGAHPGSVLVRAGYALDCCGNDIVIPCDQRVDINELVRSLPHDAGCADPCPPPEPTKDPKDPKDNGNGNGEGGDGAAQNGTKEPEGPVPPRSYQLVVEYAETRIDLVAPYSVGEETSSACEPTRVREGYRFALRCVPDEPARPPALVDALVCCAKAEEQLQKLENANATARALTGGGAAPFKTPPSGEELDLAERQLRESPGLPQAIRLAGLAVRFGVAGDEESAARALLAVRDSSKLVRQAVGNDPVAAAEAAALDERVASLSGRLQALKPTRADLLLAEGTVSGDQVGETLHTVVVEARDWALCFLEQRPGTHCELVETLAGLRVPAAADDDEARAALLKASLLVVSAVRQILIDCICVAVNPPCAPCDDEAVVLAAVAVDRCEVVEICNLARRHAITGTALRYWLPFEWIYCELDKACCGDADKATHLARARGLLRDLAAADDCGWPKRRPQGEAVYARPVEAPPTPPDLRARVEALEARWTQLEQAREGLTDKDQETDKEPETAKRNGTTKKTPRKRGTATRGTNG